MERNERLTEALESLRNPGVRRGFRQDPEGTLAHLGLTGDEIDALKSGDERRLRAAGADLTVMCRVPRTRRVANRMLGGLARFAPRGAAIALAAVVVGGSSIRGLRARMDVRHGRKSQIPRVSRYDRYDRDGSRSGYRQARYNNNDDDWDEPRYGYREARSNYDDEDDYRWGYRQARYNNDDDWDEPRYGYREARSDYDWDGSRDGYHQASLDSSAMGSHGGPYRLA